jgi:hypothetical protein
MAAETAMIFAHASGRVLVLPPKARWYLLTKVFSHVFIYLYILQSSWMIQSIERSNHSNNNACHRIEMKSKMNRLLKLSSISKK